MKTIETPKSGMTFEIATSYKEMSQYIFENVLWDWLKYGEWCEDDSIWIEYKDGSHFHLGGCFITEGKLKRTGIKTVIYDNCSTTYVYGKYRIYDVDDIDSEYSDEKDDEEKVWRADIS